MKLPNNKLDFIEYADEKQLELYKKFPSDSFLGSQNNIHNFMLWITFFRRNLHRFVKDYLGIKLYWYQTILIYLMGISDKVCVIASRASAKSFIIALYACCRCILYPNSEVVLASATRGQSRLLITSKIQKELLVMSSVLKKEIISIKDNQNDAEVLFKNGSSIFVVTANNENARGYRSTVAIREEARMIKKDIDEKVVANFQIIRQTPFLKDSFYLDKKELQEESIDIYISSSWIDSHWLWKLADDTFSDMLNGKPSCMLCFDEFIAIKHGIKSMRFFLSEKKKQSSFNFRLEVLNERIKENTSSFFSYKMLEQNQRLTNVFYPRTLIDFKNGRKNLYDIPRQNGEVRIVAMDVAFVSKKGNDNSIITCMRLLPESKTYHSSGTDAVTVDSGYRRMVCYMESIPGGDTTKQAIRLREIYADFCGDDGYIVLDGRNGGVTIFYLLANTLYDEYRGVEYPSLTCFNDDKLAETVKIQGSKPVIYMVYATQTLNSAIAMDFRRVLEDQKIDLPVDFEIAKESILPNIKEYNSAIDSETQIFYERPFLETQALIGETTELLYERKEQTNLIVIRESGNKCKDRYSSCSYANYFATQLETDLFIPNDDYEFLTLID